jgi:hypothetical protein
MGASMSSPILLPMPRVRCVRKQGRRRLIDACVSWSFRAAIFFPATRQDATDAPCTREPEGVWQQGQVCTTRESAHLLEQLLAGLDLLLARQEDEHVAGRLHNGRAHGARNRHAGPLNPEAVTLSPTGL